MECMQLGLTSWALSSIGRAMGYKPRVAGSSPAESTLQIFILEFPIYLSGTSGKFNFGNFLQFKPKKLNFGFLTYPVSSRRFDKIPTLVRRWYTQNNIARKKYCCAAFSYHSLIITMSLVSSVL